MAANDGVDGGIGGPFLIQVVEITRLVTRRARGENVFGNVVCAAVNDGEETDRSSEQSNPT